MTAQEAMQNLESLGTEQTRKTYRRHGAGENVYGVSYANLYALRKKIKQDHALARALWASGNHDARILATMIADPAQMEESAIDAWARDLTNYGVTDAFAGLVSKTTFARRKMEAWAASDEEWIGRAGWRLLSHLAMEDKTLPDGFFETHLDIIRQDIHIRKNRVRDAMNAALIAIGIRNSALEAKALAAAAQIGRVEVDHGPTGCKTPEAAAYIRKTVNRKR